MWMCQRADRGPFHPSKTAGLNEERRFSKTGSIENSSLEWREKQHVQRKRGRVDWVKIRRSGTRFEGVAWAPVGAPDESLFESTTFTFVLTHISSFLPRWPFRTWHGGDPNRRERKRESNIPYTSAASTWLVLNEEHLSECNMLQYVFSTECNMWEQRSTSFW